MCGFKIEEENKIEDKEKENQDKIPQEKRDNDDTESEDEIKERRSKRQVKPPLCFDEEYGYYCIHCNYCDFQEATTCSVTSKWKEAMDSLVKNQT